MDQLEGMEAEQCRFSSFNKFPIEWVRKVSRHFAKAGFFHTGVGDEVKCVKCGIGIINWNHDINSVIISDILQCGHCGLITKNNGTLPVTLHPSGAESRQLQAINILQNNDTNTPPDNDVEPLSKGAFMRRADAKQSVDSGFGGSFDKGFSVSQSELQNNVDYVSYEKTVPGRGKIIEKPINSDMSTTVKRFESFQTFPAEHVAQSAQQMSEAGLYYTGMADCVKCFFCDGGLHCWEVTDDPWMEHARWFPHCAYLQHCKGKEFVEYVQRGFDTSDPVILQSKQESRKPAMTYMVTEEKVAELMASELAQTACSWGYKTEDIKTVTVMRMKELGEFYGNVECLAEAIDDYNIMYRDIRSGLIGEPSQVIPEVRQVGNPEDDLKGDVSEMLSEDGVLCKICMQQEVQIMFLCCGHSVCCTDCATDMKCCSECHQIIQRKQKVLLL